ncbi:allophanate hydrolase subunit 1 [Xinfangfangia sp. CPCC 101601]|uniref:Allophanate hydrolase subunit 1 n=1 Tax=Pseudogemmobacter lacusdianii TaxID=3069608 RepID=A0ABU0VXR5_9RHOB|nr:allophanate hydrolase subunit 1 [Xinfangfangia sp. CPCC 101601]MDQ2066551.1 allophanate hydrolase subunit 1 [Xinfangfangia sp. CPCC 101601]
MSKDSPRAPRFLPVGDQAVMLEFATAIDKEAHRAVLALDAALAAQPFAGFIEAVPAFVTLLVRFDPLVTDRATVEQHLKTLNSAALETVLAGNRHEVSVVYDGSDLAEVARQCGLSEAEVARCHQSGTYEVAMYGFAPGYAYLSGLPAPLAIDRKPNAVRNVPAGSVIIAGGMCLITTLTMPTGWWRIGRTDAQVLTGNPDRPFAFAVGDKIQFNEAKNGL